MWPFLWAVIIGFDPPLTRAVPPSIWHAHEMLIGACGAALTCFITTAVPEWTDTGRPQGRPLIVLAVFAIAGLIHAGRPLGLAPSTRVAVLLLVVAVGLRVLPDLGLMPPPPGPPHALSSLAWAAAFLLWLRGYWPLFSDPKTLGARTC